MMGDVVLVCGCGGWVIVFCWLFVWLCLIVDCLL